MLKRQPLTLDNRRARDQDTLVAAYERLWQLRHPDEPMTGPGAPSLQQPPSTSDTYPPPPGGWCTCCWGTRWWQDRRKTYGWCCAWCHPPDHLAPDQVRWEPAPEPTGALL